MAIDRILLATDFSPGSSAAAKMALQLARQLDASVDVLTVVDTSPLADAYGDQFRKQRVGEIRTEAAGKAQQFADSHLHGIDKVQVHVRDGNAFLEIVQASRELGSDVIVMGTHGRTGIAHLLIGSIAEKVVRKSSVPVLTVRGPE